MKISLKLLCDGILNVFIFSQEKKTGKKGAGTACHWCQNLVPKKKWKYYLQNRTGNQQRNIKRTRNRISCSLGRGTVSVPQRI